VNSMNDHALYYPYIHVRDANWLKATLIMFSQVRRMVPYTTFTPYDTQAVQEFVECKGGPLLWYAEISSERAKQAQRALAEKLRQDAKDPAFRKRFGRQAASKMEGDSLGFQIHQAKLDSELKKVLRDNHLVWDPRAQEPYDEFAEYVELHPHVGEVVMSTLAIACAQGEGLDIVGDRRSGRLHSFLVEKDGEAIYDAWLHPRSWPEKPSKPTGEDLFEFLLGFYCDLSKLKPENLAAMGEDRKPLRKLIQKLREAASTMPAMDPGPEQNEYFRDKAGDALREWNSDRKNLPHFWRVFFGEGVEEPGAKFLEAATEKLIGGGEKAAGGAVGGAAGAAVAGATTVGGLLLPTLIGAGAGLAIGILVHAGKSYRKMGDEAKDSPYRYLTIMEKAGVVFRSDLASIKSRSSQPRPR